MPRLIAIKGADEGRQFPLDSDVLSAGRDSSSKIRLTDTEVSRRHVEFVRTPDGYRVRDVGSANGTFVNDQSVRDVLLRPGDHVQIGQTVLVYALEHGEQVPTEDLAEKISLISRQDFEVAGSIVKAVGDNEGSRILTHPDRLEGDPARLSSMLCVLYEAIQAVSHTLDLEPLLERLMDLVFRTIRADRGCILLRSTSTPTQEAPPDRPTISTTHAVGSTLSFDEFEPRAVRRRDPAQTDQKLNVSRTIVEYVLSQKQGILVSDALRDERFHAVQSVVRNAVREVICVPMKGRHQTIGVLYLDTSTPALKVGLGVQPGKFTGDHLTLAIAIAHQAALAVEETRYYQAMVHAERLAAVGQTVAALSHHIKNILQGLIIGGEVLEGGLKDKDEAAILKGWKLVRKNQAKVNELVKDMLSYSKDREPDIEPTDLNGIVREVVELMQPNAQERGIALELQLDESLSPVPADREGIHRAVLNVLANALDAVEEAEVPRVTVVTLLEISQTLLKERFVRIEIRDNGSGISPDRTEEIFKPFVSTKGSRGTGLGLAVSRKVLREHGGDIVVESNVGCGSVFALRLPLRMPLTEPEAMASGVN